MEVKTIDKKITEDFLSRLESLRGSSEKHSEGIKMIHAIGEERFRDIGFPSKKDESYKYSYPKPVLEKVLNSDNTALEYPVPDVSDYHIPNLDAYQIVLMDGCLVESLLDTSGLPKGLKVESLSNAITQDSSISGIIKKAESDAIASYGLAALRNGLHIKAEQFIEKPIHIINVAFCKNEGIKNVCIVIEVKSGADVTILESQVGTNAGASLSNTFFKVEDKGRASYQLIQKEEKANRVNNIHVEQGAASYFNTCTFTFDGDWIRNNLSISLQGERTETHLNGAFVLGGSQHLDNHTSVNHNHPNGESHQLYKGVLDEQSTGVFNGRVYVKRDAQKTNAYQSSKNILLGDRAEVNAKPELEIYADDVKCSHGSSTGKLEDEAIFYLRSRGISEESAKRIMLRAFIGDVIETLNNQDLKNFLYELASNKLKAST